MANEFRKKRDQLRKLKLALAHRKSPKKDDIEKGYKIDSLQSYYKEKLRQKELEMKIHLEKIKLDEKICEADREVL